MRQNRLAQTDCARRVAALNCGVLVVVAALTLTGCAEKKAQVCWSPAPRVAWSDVTETPAETPRDAYRILTDAPTQGLFPAAVGVTRIAVNVDGAPTAMADTIAIDSDSRLLLHRDPRNEFLRWNSSFDNQMAVSEVFPIAQRDLGGDQVAPRRINDAFHALDARVGLVYGVNELSACETEMFGAIYETATARPLALVHAQAASVPPLNDADADDPWKHDSRALVRARFERLVHGCMRELIRNDEPAPVAPVEGWVPVGPIMPVEWPPKHFGSD